MSAPPFEDLLWVIQTGIERGEHLLTEKERSDLEQLCGLSADLGQVFSRLWLRKEGPYNVDELARKWGEKTPLRVKELVALGALVVVTDIQRCLPKMTVPQLKRLALSSNVSSKGRKGELVARLSRIDIEWNGFWVSIPNRRLLVWLTQWCFLRKHPPIQTLVLERLGTRKWPEYALTPGKWGFKNREQLEEWWCRFEHLEVNEVSLRDLFEWLENPIGTGRFSLRRTIEQHIWVHFDALMLVGDHPACLALLERWSKVEAGIIPLRLERHVRLLEQMGEISQAYALLHQGFPALPLSAKYALMPLARRLGRKRNVGWKPLPVLQRATNRTLRLRPVTDRGRRPQYEVDGNHYWVESAVMASFKKHDVTLVRAEGGFLTSLYALCFSSLYFLTTSEMLPVRFLSGPLDVGYSGFYTRLEPEIQDLLTSISNGSAGTIFEESWTRFEGVRLAGMNWRLLSKSQWIQWAIDIGPDRLHALVHFIVKTGFRQTAGFPDLVWVCGHLDAIPNAFPKRVRHQPAFLEVKSPSDSMSPRQKLWMDRLIGMGFSVEQINIEHMDR